MSNALTNFDQLMESVDQLIDIHSRLQTGAGRRHRQDALHRSGVVLTVAAWQTYIEKLANEALEWIEDRVREPDGASLAPNWAVASYAFRKPAIKKSIGDLNTPNTENVRRLLASSFGFEPRSHWVWDAPNRTWDANTFSTRTDQWLRIRHTIAHGVGLPDNLPWLRNPAGNPRLNLALLKECRRHFRRKAQITDVAFASFLAQEYNADAPW